MTMLRRKSIFRLAAILLVILSIGALGYRHHKRYKHLAVHDEQMVYRSAWLEPDVFAELIEDRQIRTVLNLCNPGEMGPQRALDERRAVEGAGAKFIELPMPNTVDATDPAVGQFVNILGDPSNYPMLVHCQHGVTRTAKVLSMYDILFKGMSAQDSIDKMPRFGRDDYGVSVRSFARDFEKKHSQLFPAAANRLDPLRR
jgi:protein tyrosine phosphatase (PTP) superfamily phosphohydrolase (DUF442 family)